jgi:hypothetical protein
VRIRMVLQFATISIRSISGYNVPSREGPPPSFQDLV